MKKGFTPLENRQTKSNAKRRCGNFLTGFTLIEALVAITILIIGVLGPLALAARSISDGLFAQNQLTANMLASEALETLINQRNTNVLAGIDPFFGILEEGTDSSSEIGVVGKTGAISWGCSGGCYLTYDGETENAYITTGVGDNPNDSGAFLRQITASRAAADADELKIEVTINWKNKNVPKSFSAAEYLYAD